MADSPASSADGMTSALASVIGWAFVPPPKVDSTVLKIVPLPDARPRVPIADVPVIESQGHLLTRRRGLTRRCARRAQQPFPHA